MSRVKFIRNALAPPAENATNSALLGDRRRLRAAEVALRTAVSKTRFAAKGDLLSASAAGTPSTVSLGTAGQVLYANAHANDTDGLNYGYPQAVGEQTLMRALGYDGLCMSCPIDEASGASVALVDGKVIYQAVYLPYRATITGVYFLQRVSGTSTMTTAKVGLYTYSGGTLTRVASSSNDTTLFKGTADTFTKKAFSATYDAVPGLYYVALFADWSVAGTVPTLGLRASYGLGLPAAMSQAMGYAVTGQTDLDASETAAGAFNQPYWVDLY
jgi:hypothetical protein